MTDKPGSHQINVEVTDETAERIAFLAEREGMFVSEMAAKLLTEEAEAQAGLTRGPFLRKYIYR